MLYFFPVLYLLLGFYFRQIFGNLSLRSVDPDYLHFLSGLCISVGKFGQANIDHPGSPLQFLLAIVFKSVYFFRPHKLAYFQDVILHSDLYLSVANLMITLVIAAFLLWLGKTVLKITGNVVYALSVQTAPFLLKIWYDIIGRIYPELLFVIPVFILIALFFSEMYSDKKNGKEYVVPYAFAVAFGMALKMTFIPFLLVPLFLIRKKRNKLKYLLLTVVFFFVLALPVLFQFGKFRRWMTGIFVHSGAYQAGSSHILDTGLFVKNLQALFVAQKLFFIAFFVLVGLLVVFLVLKRSKEPLFRIGLGLAVAFLGMIFIMGKHYQMRYFVPALLFFPFILIMDLEMLATFFKKKVITVFFPVFLMLILGFRLAKMVPEARYTSKYIGAQMAARGKTAAFVKTLPSDSYKIIVSQDYGCPFQAYAVMYSFCVAGKNWPGAREKLNKLYPDTYQYFTWDNSLKYWGKPFNPDSIAVSGRPVYLYLQKNTDALFKRTENKLFHRFPGYSMQKKPVFENPENGEAIYQIRISKRLPADTLSPDTGSKLAQ